MKVLLVAVHFHSSFGWSIGRALERAGHEVHLFDYRRNPLARVPVAGAWYSGRSMPRRLLRAAAEIRPDLVFLAKGELVGGPVLEELRRRVRCRIVNWFPDARLFSYPHLMTQIPHLDVLFSKDEHDLRRMKLLGLDNGRLLMHCADPELHTELATTAQELAPYRCDVAMVGSYYPYRDLLLSRLLDFDLRIWGSGWERSRAARKRGAVVGRDARSFEQAKVFRAAKVSLNLHHYHDTDSLNQRVFDINGSGGCQLMDGTRGVERVYRVPDELDTYETLEELEAKIEALLADPGRGRAMGERARKTTAARHTYDHRIAEILDVSRP